MKMKNILLVVFSFVVVQATNAALLKITNDTNRVYVVTIEWDKGSKKEFFDAGETKFLDSGLNPINGIRWYIHGKTGESSDQYYVQLPISRVASISHKFTILSGGWYRFDNANPEMARRDNIGDNWDFME